MHPSHAEVTGASAEQAQFFLQSANGDLEVLHSSLVLAFADANLGHWWLDGHVYVL